MIKVEHLTKKYGEVLALDDLSFEIEEGQVYGFLGPNGAGKSTTMNIMTGCLSATAGSVTIGGHDVFEEPDAAKRLIGYLPEQPPLYMNETPLEYLRFVGEAKGLRGSELAAQIDEVAEQAGTSGVMRRRIGDLSKGYRQRVGIAQALLGEPRVIILDEPTVGLDPIQIIEIRDLIRSLGQSHTVILSSHILSEVQAICDKILIIAHGRLVAFDTPAKLEERLAATGELSLTTDVSLNAARKALAGVKTLAEVLPEMGTDGFTHLRLRAAQEDLYATAREVFFAFAERRLAIFKHELRALFHSFTAYVFGAFLLVVVGLGALAYNLQAAVSNFEYVLSFAGIIFVVIVPLLTMRVIAEERRQKTDQLLYALPISTTDVVLGKYAALLVVFLVPLAVIAVYPLIFSCFGEVYLPVSYGSIFAYFVMGAALIAVGVFLSSLTENQGMAAGLGVAVILFNYYSVSLSEYVSQTAVGTLIALCVLILALGFLARWLTKNVHLGYAIWLGLTALCCIVYVADATAFEGLLPKIMKTLSLFERLNTFVNGVFDLTALVYFLSVIVVFLFLTVQSLEKRRYN